MAKDQKDTNEEAPKDYDEVASNADAKKTVRQQTIDPEKVDPVTNQKLGDFMRTTDDKEMQDAINRANREQTSGHPGSRMATADAMLAMKERDDQANASAEEALASHDERQEGVQTQVPVEIWRARENARIKAEASARHIDETVPGGRYFENGRWVNCDGVEIK